MMKKTVHECPKMSQILSFKMFYILNSGAYTLPVIVDYILEYTRAKYVCDVTIR